MKEPIVMPPTSNATQTKAKPPRRKIGEDPRDELFIALEMAQDQLADDFSIIILGRPRKE